MTRQDNGFYLPVINGLSLKAEVHVALYMWQNICLNRQVTYVTIKDSSDKQKHTFQRWFVTSLRFQFF